MSIRVFVSGPLTSSGLTTENVRKACEAGNKLMNLGYVPFIPHVNILMEMICPRGEQDWVDWDKRWLEVCDVVLRIPGYSKHGDLECDLARELGIPVFGGAEVSYLDAIDRLQYWAKLR